MRDIRELFPIDDPVKPDLLIGRGDDVRDLVPVWLSSGCRGFSGFSMTIASSGCV